MKTVRNLLFIVAGSALIMSCGNMKDKVEDKLNEAVEEMEEAIEEDIEEATTELQALDMTEMGIPIVISVPEGTEVSEGIMHSTEGEFQYYDYELTFDKYVVNVTMDPEGMYQTIPEMVESAKDIYLDETSEIIEEFADGFIYKVMYDDEEDYSFYYVKEKGEMAIEFTTGLTFDFYSLEDAENMYDAAKSAE